MAEAFDVAGRLAEGRPAVDNVSVYVWACHLLGYQSADLTLHSGQVRDWYSGEDGLDLRALDADRAALDAVAATAETAQQLQEEQVGVLAGAWQGRAGDASRAFLLRHGDASRAVTASLRRTVDALAALRDDLWHTVDEKVSAAVEIDERHAAERPQWQAATRTVTTGAGDRSVASELIDQQVKPFVENDIGSDWLTAMQKAMASVASCFEAATAALGSEPAAMFDVPGDLGPYWAPAPSGIAPIVTAGTVPSGWVDMAPAAAPMTASAPAYAPAASAVPAAVAEPIPAAAAAPPAASSAMPSVPSLGDLGGGGLPGGTGGLAGLGTQIADALGGLLDRFGEVLPDAPDPADDLSADDPVAHDTSDDDPPDDGGSDDGDPDEGSGDETADETAELDDTCHDQDSGEPHAVETDAVTSPPLPTTAPMPPPPVPIAEPTPELSSTETPCEIAADELPQAGP